MDIDFPIKLVFGCISVVASIAGFSFYLRELLAKRTTAHALSWLVWSFMGSIIFVIQISNGAGAGSWGTGTSTMFSIVVFFVAICDDNNIEITTSDWINFTFAGLTFLVYVLAKNPLISIIMIIATDMFGFLPTVRKNFVQPFEESPSIYAASCIRSLLAILAMENYATVTWLQQGSTMVISSAFLLMLYARRNRFVVQTNGSSELTASNSFVLNQI